ncbi:MAG TPA: DUF4337 domain-containing protein [Burkholderiaceae bacterium]|jgi:hypothetical protein
MAEEKKEPWLNYLALSTVIFAVCATLSTFKGGGYSTRSVLSQAQASDQWAFYQAKSIKENLYQLQLEKVQLEIKLDADANAAKRAAYQEAVESYQKKVAAYAKDKADIKLQAESLEKLRDDAKKHGEPFGLAVILLQIAILISSIAALLKRKELWYLAMPVGIVGIVFFADGFLLFY